MSIQYVFSPNRKISTRAAEVISHILKLVTVTTWRDPCLGTQHYYLETRYIQILCSFDENLAVHLLGYASLNRDGYVREQALLALSELNHPEMLPYLLIRLSDWVKVNQTRARQILLSKFPLFTFTQIFRLYPLICSLEKVQRVNLSEIKQMFDAKLVAEENRESLFSLMQNVSTQKKILYWNGLQSVFYREASLLQKALADLTAEIRSWAVFQLKILPNWQTQLKTLLSDRSSRVRYIALKLLQTENVDLFIPELTECLFDPCKPIRELSRFLLKTVPISELCETRFSENSESMTVGVLAAYIETARGSISNDLLNFIRHPRSQIRALSLLGLAYQKFDEAGSYAVKVLLDPSNKVKKAAVSVLLMPGVIFSRVELRSVLNQGSYESRRFSLRVLSALGGLEAIRDILNTIVAQDDLREEAWVYLETWCKRYLVKAFFSKTHVNYEIEELICKLQSNHLDLPPKRSSSLGEILFLLKTIP